MRGLYFQIILSMHSSIIKFYHVFLRLFPSKFYLFRVKKLFNLSFFIFFIMSDHTTALIMFFEMNILLIQAKWTLFPSLYRYFNFISQRCAYIVQILQPSSPSFSLIFPSALLPTMSSQPDIHSGTPTSKKAQFYHLQSPQQSLTIILPTDSSHNVPYDLIFQRNIFNKDYQNNYTLIMLSRNHDSSYRSQIFHYSY